jgi:cytoskeletal protein RodZ
MKDPNQSPQSEQIQKLKELGSYLHQIRHSQGLSLETIANRTMIQTRLLKAIEEGNLKVLPEPVYIKVLLKKYGDAMGLEGQDLADAFPDTYKIKKLKPIAWLRTPSLQLRPFHLYFIYIVLIFASVQGISNLVKNSGFSDFSELRSTDSSGKKETKTSNSSQKSPVATLGKPLPGIIPASIKETDPNKPVVVEITLKDQSWLQIVVDGKKEFEGVLPQGSHRTWAAKKQLTVKAGNAGGVLIAFNDKQAKKLGEPGKVQQVTYKAIPSS